MGNLAGYTTSYSTSHSVPLNSLAPPLTIFFRAYARNASGVVHASAISQVNIF
jgi:hypothetical protein